MNASSYISLTYQYQVSVMRRSFATRQRNFNPSRKTLSDSWVVVTAASGNAMTGNKAMERESAVGALSEVCFDFQLCKFVLATSTNIFADVIRHGVPVPAESERRLNGRPPAEPWDLSSDNRILLRPDLANGQTDKHRKSPRLWELGIASNWELVKSSVKVN